MSDVDISPVQRLHERLTANRGKIKKIKIGWNASDGGPRMNVELFDYNGVKIDEWNDWLIMGYSRGITAGQAIEEIIVDVFGARRFSGDYGFYYANFEIR